MAAYQNVGRSYGIELGEATIRARFREAIQRYSVYSFQRDRGVVEPLRTDEQSESLRWQAIVRFVLSPSSNQELPVFQCLWDHFGQPENWQLFDDVLPTLSFLRENGFRLGLASNFDQRLRPIVENLLGKFDLDLFISSEVGWVKPAESFYAEVTRQLDVPPNQILLIGDDWKNDVAAPRKFGWQTAYLRREGKPSDDDKFNANETLRNAVHELFLK